MKKSIFKTLAVFIILTIISTCFIGCESENSDVDVFTMWTNSGHTKQFMDEAVAEFNNTIGKENSMKIEYTVYGGDYAQSLEMAIANGKAPDFFNVQGSMQTQVDKGNVFPISDLPDMDEFLSKYEGYLVENEDVINDKVYKVPMQLTTFGFIYNKDLFKEAGLVDETGEAVPPKTWDEVVEYAKKLTNPSKKVYGIALPIKWGAFWGIEMGKSALSSYGRHEYDVKSDKYDFGIYKDIMEYLLQIKKDGSYFPGAESLDNDQARAQFAEGRVAMKFAASWDVGVLNDQFPAQCDWGVAPLPVLKNGEREYYQPGSYSSFVDVSSSVKDKDLKKVAIIYKWINSDEMINGMYEEGLVLPWNSNIIKDKENISLKQGWSEFANLSSISKPYVGWVPLKLEGQTYAEYFDKVWHGELEIDEAIQKANDTYNEAYRRGIKNNDFDFEKYKSIGAEAFNMKYNGAE